jgi:DNA-binding CsgD family transcriptional regulator
MDLALIKIKLWQRRQDIAGRWQASLAEFAHNYPITLSQFTKLVEVFITALFEAPVAEEKVYALGADFVQTHFIHPQVLVRTQTVLLQELVHELCPDELKAVQPLLIQAYNCFLAGYGEFAYTRFIDHQEKEIKRLTALQEQAKLFAMKQDASRFSLVEQVSNPIIFHDGEYILDANPAAHTRLASSAQPLKGKPVLTLFAPWAQKSLAQVLQTTTIEPYETAVSPTPSSPISIIFHNIPLPYQQQDAFALIIHISSQENQPRKLPPNNIFLTHREAQILRLIATDYDDKTIGEILEIAPTTVKFHVRNAQKKLGVSSRAAAVHKAGQYGLLEV